MSATDAAHTPEVAVVTGGGGFVGRHLVRQLIDRGDTVRTIGRRRYDGLPDEVEQHQLDLTADDLAEQLRPVLRDASVVYHTAGKVGAGVDDAAYKRANVHPIVPLLEACRDEGVTRLVYTSTPSVVFGRTGHTSADESLPYADPREQPPYARTKAVAEAAVLAASGVEDHAGRSVLTTAIRPHLVFGPGDGSLMPRIVDRARAGRLRLVGPGDSPISVAYVGNVAAAHLQAADELAGQARNAGRAYFINEDPPPDGPLTTRRWIDTLLAMAGEPPVTRSIPPAAAIAVGAMLERWYRFRGRTDEPIMTPFIARSLSQPHSYRTDAARRDFGYSPVVDWDEALARTQSWAAERFGGEEATGSS